ncbi:MAG: hypothetical protein HY898_18990 [Deltaproteobacteria bacterium]|nr:hypothetical protein [Deltaproteobacteria bacterium]
MDPAEFAALAKRLIDDAKDQEALAAAHMMELTDPGGYALLLEKVAYGSGDPRTGSRWFVQAATVWSNAMGDARRAENLLRKAVKSDPWNDQAMERLARVYDDRGDLDTLLSILEGRAAACANKVGDVEDGKGRASAMYCEIGRRAASARPARTDQALAAYEKAVLTDPKSMEAIRGARSIHIASGRWGEAIAMFDKERALLRKPADHVHLLREEAAVRRAAGDLDGVAQALRLALGCDENDLDVTEELANSLVERIKAGEDLPRDQRSEAATLFLVLAETYDGEIALSHALNALSADPGNDRAIELAGSIASGLHHEAVMPAYWAAYLKAAPAGPNASRIRLALADSHEAAGQYGEAADVLVPLEAHNGKVAQRVLVLMKKAGRVDELIARLDRQAASLPPDARFDVVLQAARMLSKAGRMDAAVQRYTQLLAIHPGFAEAVKFVSDYMRERKNLKGLSAVLLSAARHAKTPVDQRGAMLREVAKLSIEIGDYDEAYDILSKLHQTSRGDETVRDQLKKVLEHTARWDELTKLIGREIGAARSAEETIAALRQLASLQEHKIGDLEQAANAWSRISMLAPEDAAALMSGVELYEKAKRQDLSASLLATGIERMKSDASREAAYGRLAEVLEKLDRPTEAADAHASRAQITGAAESWRAAERLYATAQAWDKASDALRRQLEATTDPKLLAALHARQAGYLAQSGEAEASVRALEQAVELDQDEEAYVGELERRNEAAGNLRRFVDFLVQRASVLEDKTKRSALRRRAARILRERLDDRAGALDTLRAVLQDEEDPGALALLAADAELHQRFEEACDLLTRLQASLSESSTRTPILLKLAKAKGDGLGDVDGALQVLEQILRETDPRNREAVREIVRLKGGRGDWQGVVAVLEQARANAESPEYKKQLALELSEIHERKLNDPAQATVLVLAAIELEPGDSAMLRRLADLYEARAEWEPLVEVLSKLIAADSEPEQVTSLVLRRSSILEQRLGRVEEALAGIEVLGDGGDTRARAAFVEMADRCGRRDLAATTLENWSARDAEAGSPVDGLIGAFDRYVIVGRLTEAARVVRRLKAGDPAVPGLALRLEEAALAVKDFEVARIAEEILLANKTGLERSVERVRQAEVLVAAGADRPQTLRTAETEFVGLAPQDALPLLARLAELTTTPEERLGLYERQVARSSGRTARIAALASAVGVAARNGLMPQCKRLFLLGVSVSGEDSDILPLEREAIEVDNALGGTTVRRAYTEALVEAAATVRGGELRRGALLRKAALIAHRDLGDIAQAFDWFNEALFVRIESSMVAMSAQLQNLSEQVRELKAALPRQNSEPPSPPAPRKGPPPLPTQTAPTPSVPPPLPAQADKKPPQLPKDPPPKKEEERAETTEPNAEAAIPVLVDLTADDDDAQPSITEKREPSRDEATQQDIKRIERPVEDLSDSDLLKDLSSPGVKMPLAGAPQTVDQLHAKLEAALDSHDGDSAAVTQRRSLSDVLNPSADTKSASEKKRLTPVDDPRVRSFASVSEMFSQTDLMKGVEVALRLAMQAVDGGAGMLHLLDASRHEFVLACAAGMNNSVKVGHRTAEDESTAAEVVEKKFMSTTIETGAERWYLGKRWWSLSPAPQQVLGASIEHKGKVIGLLEIALTTPGASHDEAGRDAIVYLAQRVAEYVAARPRDLEAALKP